MLVCVLRQSMPQGLKRIQNFALYENMPLNVAKNNE